MKSQETTLQPSAADSPRLGLAKHVARRLVAQQGAATAAPAIEYASNLSQGLSGRSHTLQKSRTMPAVLGATRR